MPSCKSCRRPIVFLPTKKGRQMPVDPETCDDGNVVMRRWAGGDPVVHILADGEEPLEGEIRYRSHFASCPEADKHRRRR